jgi:hypothetical protein
MDIHALAWIHRGSAVDDRARHLDACTSLTHTTGHSSPPDPSDAECRRQPGAPDRSNPWQAMPAGTTREGLA